MNKYDLLLHVDKTDGSLNIAFSNAINYARALHGREAFKMVLVANSGAVTQLTADNAAIKTKLEEAVAAGLQIKVCKNALDANNITPDKLYSQCAVVPAGVVEIVDLQRAGFAYVKP